MTIYDQMLAAVPSGPEYDAEGQILPFLDGPHQFQWTLGVASSRVLVFIDGQQAAELVTDADGIASADIFLGTEPGTYELLICQPGSFDTPLVSEILTTRKSATLHQAATLTFEELQTYRNRLRNALSAAGADSAFLDVWGARAGLTKPADWSTEAYRAAVVAWLQDERHFGGLVRGLRTTMSSARSNAPLILPQAWLPGIDGGSLVSTKPMRLSVAGGGAAFEEDELEPHAGPQFARHGGASGGGALGGTLSGLDFVWERANAALPENSFPVANANAHAAVYAATAPVAVPTSTSPFAAAGITQPYDASIGGDGGIFSGTTYLGTRTAARLSVNYAALWNGVNVVVTGVDADNITQSETFTYTGTGLVHGNVYFKSITSITHTGTPGVPAGTASIGLRDRLFLRLVSVGTDGLGSLPIGSNTVTYTDSTQSLALNGGTAVPISAGTVVSTEGSDTVRQLTLRGPGTPAYLVANRSAANFDTREANRLRMNVDYRGAVELTVTAGAAVSPATMRDEINADLSLDPRYVRRTVVATGWTTDGAAVETITGLATGHGILVNDYITFDASGGSSGDIVAATIVTTSAANSIIAQGVTISGSGGAGVISVIEPAYRSFAATVTHLAANDTIRLRNTTTPLTSGTGSRISLEKSALAPVGTTTTRGDLLYKVFGLPNVCGFLASAYSTGTTVTLDAVHSLPTAVLANAETAWTGWIGRGRRLSGDGCILTALDDRTATIELTGGGGTDLFTPGDIGGYVTLSNMTSGANNGTHRIIAVARGTEVCTVVKDVDVASAFVGETVASPNGDWIVYSRGERADVSISSPGSTTVTITNTLQADEDGTPYAAGSFFELADGTGANAVLGAVVIDGDPYVGEVVVEVNTAEDAAPPPGLLPSGDTSDTLTIAGNTAPAGWTITNATMTRAVGQYNSRRAILTATGADCLVTVACPGAGRDFPGWRLRARAHVGQHLGTAAQGRLDISYDGGDTYTSGTPLTLSLSYFDASNLIGQLYPMISATPALINTVIEETFDVPALNDFDVLSDIRVRLVFVGAAATEVFSVDSFVVEVVAHDHQAIVRDARGEDGTHWVYYWPAMDATATTAAAVDDLATTASDIVSPAASAMRLATPEVEARVGAYQANEFFTVMGQVLTAPGLGETFDFEVSNLDGSIDSAISLTYTDASPTLAEARDLIVTAVNVATTDTGVTATAVGTSFFVLTTTTGLPFTVTNENVRLAFVYSMINCESTAQAPIELAFIQPSRTSEVRNEILQLSSSSPYNAALTTTSTAEGSPVGTYPQDPTTDAVLVELPSVSGPNAADADGISFTNENTNWTWRSATSVTVADAVYSTSSAFALTYNALIRAQTGVIDLSQGGALTDWADFLWLFDAPYWHGVEPNIAIRATKEVGLTFDATGVAPLADAAATTAGSYLRVNDGRRIRTLSGSEWKWITRNSLTLAPRTGLNPAVGVAFAVRLTNPASFNPDAGYTLHYAPADLTLTDCATLTFYVRGGAAEQDCMTTAWTEIEPNAPLPLLRGVLTGTPASQFFQFRADWSGVVDQERTKLWGLGAKGIRLRGASRTSTTTPGIIS